MSYPLLERINAPGEIKNLPASDMPALCEEIRQFLIKSVSETGGHLSSNLGVVELTVALHRVLDFPQDKLLFDVGHQCYTHKLLTGRREGFAQLRRKNGISGFPSPRESDCDAFIAGHGSAALSTAIGIARAKKLKNEPGKVVVIVGDGAFTGGMVYEGMNNVSKLNNLIVILNDNKMSISKNVGQMANYLTKLRTDPKYSHVKAHMETTLERIPVAGDALVRVLQGGKQLIRRVFYVVFKKHTLDFVIGNHTCQSIRAKQETIRRKIIRRQQVGRIVAFRPQCTGDDIAARMHPRFFFCNQSRADKLADQRMILRNLLQLIFAQTIDAAVTDMRNIHVPVRAPHHRKRRTHARTFLMSFCMRENPFVRGENGFFQQLDARFLPLSRHMRNRINRHRTGDFARQMSAHAVRNSKHAALLVKPRRVFILLALFADIGAHRRRHAVHSPSCYSAVVSLSS